MNKSTHFPLQPFNLAYDFTDDINKDPDLSVSSGTYPRKAVPAVPLCEKWLLSIEEASIYFGVGQNRLAKLATRSSRMRYRVLILLPASDTNRNLEGKKI